MDIPNREHEHQPKKITLNFTEKNPNKPESRPSRHVPDPGPAGVRLIVEEIITAHTTPDLTKLRELGRDAQKIIHKMITAPTKRDLPFRREAVSALAALGDPQSVTLLAALATDPDEDEVIIGRAYDGLAEIGGIGACQIITRGLENANYVGDRSLRALMKLRHPSSVATLVAAAQTHPSELIRNRAFEALQGMDVEVPIEPPSEALHAMEKEKRIAQEDTQ